MARANRAADLLPALTGPNLQFQQNVIGLLSLPSLVSKLYTPSNKFRNMLCPKSFLNTSHKSPCILSVLAKASNLAANEQLLSEPSHPLPVLLGPQLCFLLSQPTNRSQQSLTQTSDTCEATSQKCSTESVKQHLSRCIINESKNQETLRNPPVGQHIQESSLVA